MKGLANVIAVVGILLIVYSIIGRFFFNATIGLGILAVEAKSVLILANSLLLLSLVLKQWSK